jgi:hypothetical protein
MPYSLGMQPKAVLFVTALLFLWAAQPCAEAQVRPGESLQQFLRGNDRFGLRLLAQNHAAARDKNAVVAPLSLTILLSAIEDSSSRKEAREQLRQLFGWEGGIEPGIPSQMMLAAMEPPKIGQAPPGAKQPKEQPWEGESLWVANRLLYRSRKDGPPLLERWFVQRARERRGAEN